MRLGPEIKRNKATLFKLRSIIFIIIGSGNGNVHNPIDSGCTQHSQPCCGLFCHWYLYEIFIVIIQSVFSNFPLLIMKLLTPTIILVRVSMGLSFHDEASMAETAGSLHFASSDRASNTGSPILET